MQIQVINSDCITALREMPDNSVEAIVTDPPYGLSRDKTTKATDAIKRWSNGELDYVPTGRGFVGNTWDSFVPPPLVWIECLRVLKPGGYMAVFSGTRTVDLMGLSLRLAGCEVKDMLAWINGNGFPKGLDVGKALQRRGEHELAEWWEGWRTALKPAVEPILLVRKPPQGNTVGNTITWGVGGLNIDGCRAGTREHEPQKRIRTGQGETVYQGNRGAMESVYTQGRFPPNVLLDSATAGIVDAQTGVSKSSKMNSVRSGKSSLFSGLKQGGGLKQGYGDEGGASRYFPTFLYRPKAPKSERPTTINDNGEKITHPTVKPVGLMEWLVTLITPPGGTVLDPFAGSGATLQAAHNKGFDSVGIEREKDYIKLINKRLEKVTNCEKSTATSTVS